MSGHDSLYKEISFLTCLSIEGKINEQQFARLEHLIQKDPLARRCYLMLINNDLCMYDYDVIRCFNDVDIIGSSFNLQELADYEKIAPAIELPPEQRPKKQPQTELIQKVVRPKMVHKVNKFSLYTAVSLSAAAMLLMAFVLFYQPPEPILAYVNEQSDAEWGVNSGPLEVGNSMRGGQFKLDKGFSRIVFNSGSEILVEAPADFELFADDQMILSSGKLTAKVPERAKGFIVQTPTASVVDYGTEFSVSVDSATNATEVYVFEGLVEMRDSHDPSRFNTSMKLEAGMAAAVKDGQVNRVYETVPERFVRDMPSDYEMEIRRSNPRAYWRFGDSLTNIIGAESFVETVYGKVDYTEVRTPSGQDLKVLSMNPYQSSGKIDVDYAKLRTPSGQDFKVLTLNRNQSSIGGINYGDVLNPGPKSLTVSMWIKPFGLENNRTQHLADKRTYGHNFGWVMMIVGNDIVFRTGTNHQETVWTGRKDAITEDWHHVVMVIDRESNTLKGYLDGSAQGWNTQVPGEHIKHKIVLGTDTYSPTAEVVAGGNLWVAVGNSAFRDHKPQAVSVGSSQAFYGFIYDMAVWNRPLSEREVRTLYNQCPLSDIK